jgi:hypothetical protein
MGSANVPSSSASSDRPLDFRLDITPEESKALQAIRYQYQPSPTAYLRWLTECTEGLFRRKVSLEPPKNFDRPFELPKADDGER